MPAHKDLLTTVILVSTSKAALDSVVDNYEEGQLAATEDTNYLYYVKITNNTKSWVRLVT